MSDSGDRQLDKRRQLEAEREFYNSSSEQNYRSLIVGLLVKFHSDPNMNAENTLVLAQTDELLTLLHHSNNDLIREIEKSIPRLEELVGQQSKLTDYQQGRNSYRSEVKQILANKRREQG